MPGQRHRDRSRAAALEALRAMAQDHRQLDPVKYAHLREQLGLAPPDTPATGSRQE